MRYAQIRNLDISNGDNVGISLFVQGCHFHCKNCFNKETWDFNGGQQWTNDIENEFLELTSREYINRISFLGGEPLANENVVSVKNIIDRIHMRFGSAKKIWLYTGYTWEEIFTDTTNEYSLFRQMVIKNIDVLVDGRFEIDKVDLTLPYRGSHNQRVIDVPASFEQRKIIHYA